MAPRARHDGTAVIAAERLEEDLAPIGARSRPDAVQDQGA